jgi:hypothetical protein
VTLPPPLAVAVIVFTTRPTTSVTDLPPQPRSARW